MEYSSLLRGLAAVESAFDAIRFKIRRKINEFVPINRLPPELLTAILRKASSGWSPYLPERYVKSVQGAALLTCWHWHDIILADPIQFQAMYFVSTDAQTEAALSTFFKLSKSLDIDVAIAFEGGIGTKLAIDGTMTHVPLPAEHVAACSRIINEHSKKLLCLTLRFQHSQWRDIFPHLRSPCPTLKALTLDMESWTAGSLARRLPLTLPSSLFANQMPVLRQLRLSHCLLHSWELPQLQGLHLSQDMDWDLRALHTILPCLRNLRAFHLRFTIYNPENDNPPVFPTYDEDSIGSSSPTWNLPMLQEVLLDTIPPEGLSFIARCMSLGTISNLTILHVQTSLPIDVMDSGFLADELATGPFKVHLKDDDVGEKPENVHLEITLSRQRLLRRDFPDYNWGAYELRAGKPGREADPPNREPLDDAALPFKRVADILVLSTIDPQDGHLEVHVMDAFGPHFRLDMIELLIWPAHHIDHFSHFPPLPLLTGLVIHTPSVNSLTYMWDHIQWFFVAQGANALVCPALKHLDLRRRHAPYEIDGIPREESRWSVGPQVLIDLLQRVIGGNTVNGLRDTTFRVQGLPVIRENTPAGEQQMDTLRSLVGELILTSPWDPYQEWDLGD